MCYVGLSFADSVARRFTLVGGLDLSDLTLRYIWLMCALLSKSLLLLMSLYLIYLICFHDSLGVFVRQLQMQEVLPQ